MQMQLYSQMKIKLIQVFTINAIQKNTYISFAAAKYGLNINLSCK